MALQLALVRLVILAATSHRVVRGANTTGTATCGDPQSFWGVGEYEWTAPATANYSVLVVGGGGGGGGRDGGAGDSGGGSRVGSSGGDGGGEDGGGWRLLLGELTLYPGGGAFVWEPPAFDDYLGSFVGGSSCEPAPYHFVWQRLG